MDSCCTRKMKKGLGLETRKTRSRDECGAHLFILELRDFPISSLLYFHFCTEILQLNHSCPAAHKNRKTNLFVDACASCNRCVTLTTRHWGANEVCFLTEGDLAGAKSSPSPLSSCSFYRFYCYLFITLDI